jgi:riboflavin synthase
MKYSFLKLPQLSGSYASIYTILVETEDTNETLLDQFIKENEAEAPNEVKNIVERLRVIGRRTGAREQFLP